MKNPVVSPLVTTTYYVTVTSGTQTANSSASVTVTLNPLTADASATPSTICAGQTSQLNVVPAGGSGSYTYSWTSDPPGFTSNLQNPVVQPAVTTQYTANVSDGSQNAMSTADVTVIPVPTAYAGPDTTYCSDITSIPLNGTAASYTTVLWTTSGTGSFTDATSLVNEYLPSTADISDGMVDLTLSADPVAPCLNPVSSVRYIIFDPCLGIPGNNGSSFSVTVSPNPTQGWLQVSVKGLAAGNAEIKVYDIRGVSVLTRSLNGTGTLTESLDLSSKPGGLYFISVQTPHEIKVQKVILQ
jgi:hypothetical protein